jgi:hypothetical protein
VIGFTLLALRGLAFKGEAFSLLGSTSLIEGTVKLDWMLSGF